MKKQQLESALRLRSVTDSIRVAAFSLIKLPLEEPATVVQRKAKVELHIIFF